MMPSESWRFMKGKGVMYLASLGAFNVARCFQSCVAVNNSVLTEETSRPSLLNSRSASHASSASFSSQGENDAVVPRISNSPQHRQSKVFGSSTRKAKRIRFFRNGDRFFKGVVMPVTPERYRSFDSLLADVTRTLKDHVTLPNGVRNLYTTDGIKVGSVDDLEDGKCYVCSGQGESFKRIEYLNLSSRKGKQLRTTAVAVTSRDSLSPAVETVKAPRRSAEFIRPRVVTLVRNGVRPRRIVRLLLNKRNAPSFEHVLSSITEVVKLDTGAVRKVFSATGIQLFTLQDFFLTDDLFFVYGSERYSQDDFLLDVEELKAVNAHKKSLPQRAKDELSGALPGSLIPKMPKKKGGPVTESRETDLNIPSQVRMKYKVGGIVGDGNFAVVRRCSDRLKGGDFAMKIIDKSKCKGREQMIENEVEILRNVCHPNIIRLLAEFDTSTELYLIMELEGGDLFDAIAASTKFPEDEARLMITHLASALAYLHHRNIVHRDVKPENLLVRFDENRKLRSLKLGDFGLAQHVVEPLTAICGTPTYVAPEILFEGGYGLKVDVWAAGVILYILLCGFPPFVSSSEDQEELFDKILSGIFEFTSPYWDPISWEAKDLISNMLQNAPEIRFSPEDVLDHPWLHCEDVIDSSTRYPDSPARRPKLTPDLQNMEFSG